MTDKKTFNDYLDRVKKNEISIENYEDEIEDDYEDEIEEEDEDGEETEIDFEDDEEL